MTIASYLSPKTAVHASDIAGRGLRAVAPIGCGEIVCVKGGHLVDRAALERNRAIVNESDMQIADDLYLVPLSADEFESVMMFVNHSCEPNVGVQGQIVFLAMRDIAVGEELTLDYATVDHDCEPMACRCGTASCRGTITGDDWRLPELQRKYADYFAWHILRRMRADS